MKITVFYDGACEPVNPGGHGGFGCFIYFGKKRAYSFSGYVPASPFISNNVVEYMGLIRALEWLFDNDHENDEIEFYGDNMMTVKQMAGKWRAKGGLYIPYYEKAREILAYFKHISFTWIPREENVEADELSKAEFISRGIHERIPDRDELTDNFIQTTR